MTRPPSSSAATISTASAARSSRARSSAASPAWCRCRSSMTGRSSAILGGGYRRIAARTTSISTTTRSTSLVHGQTRRRRLADMARRAASSCRVAGARREAHDGRARRRSTARASAARTFTSMTLFDHYCAKLHTGPALDGPTALALREEIVARDRSARPARSRSIRSAAAPSSAARATITAPLELADLASRRPRCASCSRSTSEVTEAEHVDDVEQAMEAALADRRRTSCAHRRRGRGAAVVAR